MRAASTMNATMTSALAAVVLLAGCGDKPPTPAPAAARPKVAPPPPSVPAQPKAAPGTPPAAATPAVGRGDEPQFNNVNDALHAWIQTKGSLPLDLNDLVKANLVDKLPTPPPGKKLAIDLRTHSVVMVNQ